MTFDPALFSLIFVLALLSSLALQSWLNQRQLRHVMRHREQVPKQFADKIPLADHQKAADYTRAKLVLERYDLALSGLLVLLWTLGGGIELVDRFWATYFATPLWHGVMVILSIILISSVLSIPLELYSTFGIEQRYGFNRMTRRVYLLDKLRGLLLFLILGAPLILCILWVMLNTDGYWWVYACAVLIGFNILTNWLFPTVIAPLYNKFAPLQDSALQQRIEALLQRCGFASRGIFVMDGSKRSSHGNAYFAGLGRNKRIVFFDTLLKQLTASEIEAVLAHELGHFKHKHLRKMLWISAVMFLTGFALLGILIQQPWFYTGLGVSTPSAHTALILFTLVMPLFFIYLQPLFSQLSRRHEFEADDFAATQTQANDLIQALVKLYQENAKTLTPDPLYSVFYESHPSAPIRIAHLQAKVAH